MYNILTLRLEVIIIQYNNTITSLRVGMVETKKSKKGMK